MRHEQILVASAEKGSFPLDIYVPDALAFEGDALRPAVLICPGGGYHFCNEREAEPIALAFLARGFNAFVAWYRVEPYRFPVPVLDVAAALALIRRNARAWRTDPAKIAVAGFSAGGHAAACLATRWQEADWWTPLGLAPEDVKPNAQILCYAVITGKITDGRCHEKSFEHLTGTTDRKRFEALSVEDFVTPNCPPTFIWHTFRDELVPVQHPLLMAQATIRNGVPTELHIFSDGIHGLALCDETTANPNETQRLRPDIAVWFSMAVSFLRRAL